MKLKIIPWLKSFQFHIVGKLLTLATFILSLHRFHLNEVSILQSSSNKSNHKKFLAQHNTSFYLSNRSESCTFLPVPICFDLYYIELPGRPKLPPDIHHHRVSVLLLYRQGVRMTSTQNLIYQDDPTKIFGVVLNIRTLKVVLGILLNVSLFCIEHRAPGAKSAKNGWLDHFLILEKNWKKCWFATIRALEAKQNGPCKNAQHLLLLSKMRYCAEPEILSFFQ